MTLSTVLQSVPGVAAPVAAPAPTEEAHGATPPAAVEAPEPLAPVPAPEAPVTNMLDLVLPEGTIIAKKTSSLCSTPRSIVAER